MVAALLIGSRELDETPGHVAAPVACASATFRAPAAPPAPAESSAPASDGAGGAATLSAEERTHIGQDVVQAVREVVPDTDIGFALFDDETGEVVASVASARQFYTASVVKLLIALDALHIGGWHAPDPRLHEQLTEMLRASHDGVASSLWDRGGRTAIIERMVRLIGLSNTAAPRIADQWEMTRTTADDVVRTYRYLMHDVPAEASEPILTALAAAESRAADGFPQYFGIPDGLPTTSWAVKQGWMEIMRAVVLNTTGVVDSRYIVVLLGELPLGTSYADGRAALTAGVGTLNAPLRG